MSATQLTIAPVPRVFHHGSLVLPDPNPRLTPEEVRKVFATQYPELLNAGLEGPSVRGGKQIFTFQKSLGTKG